MFTASRIFLKAFLAIAILTVSQSFAAADFDKDGKADFALFRPSSGVWMTQPANGEGGFTAFQWGTSSDVLVPADYDGDHITDVAVWRPENGTWYIRRSTDNSFAMIQWGRTTAYPTGDLADVPVPADYDGDGLADIAVWRPDTGEWFVLKSSTRYNV
ncbi:MAG TPA: VCBS repeat-containing protein, partial [Pyrinomonadaceae bacterium]|nr:VCBS repeat-containing protein [Pyrinomonadaceae bacterium]